MSLFLSCSFTHAYTGQLHETPPCDLGAKAAEIWYQAHLSCDVWSFRTPKFVGLEQRKELLNGAYERYPFIQMYLTHPLFSSSAGTSTLWAVTRVIQNRLIQKCRITAFLPLTQSQLETYCVAAFWIVWVLRFQTAHRWRFTCDFVSSAETPQGVSTSGLLGTARRKLPRSRFEVGKGKPATGSDGELFSTYIGGAMQGPRDKMCHPNVAKHGPLMKRNCGNSVANVCWSSWIHWLWTWCISPQKINHTWGRKKHLMTKLEYPALDLKSSKITIPPLAEHKNQLLTYPTKIFRKLGMWIGQY